MFYYAEYGNTTYGTNVQLSFNLDESGDWYGTFQLNTTAPNTPTSFTFEYYTDPSSPCASPCDSISHATEPSLLDTSECLCDDGYTWDANNTICSGGSEESGLNCDEVDFATEADGTDACKCKNGYEWSSEEQKCMKDNTLAIALGVTGGGKLCLTQLLEYPQLPASVY